MSRQSDYLTGRIDTTIHDFLAKIEEPTSSMAYALITCLDSDFDVPSLLHTSRHLESLKGRAQEVGQGILVTTRQLLTAHRHSRIFFGFDEVWFFPTSEVTPKPDNLVLAGPSLIDPADIEEHSEWMRVNECSLGLGDGTGMNFCFRVRGVARYIVQAFSEAGIQEVAS